MAKSSDEMTQTMINNLKEKTGKTMDQWLKHLGKMSLEKHGEIVKHLKGEHGVTHGFANLIALTHLRGDEILNPTKTSTDNLIETQYAGDKGKLKPIYDAVIAAGKKFGPDVEIAPKKAYVSLRRKKQFAIVQPTTKTRIDIGLVLKEVSPAGRLEAAGSFNSMMTHRVKVSTKKEVNAELKQWLKAAYDKA